MEGQSQGRMREEAGPSWLDPGLLLASDGTPVVAGAQQQQQVHWDEAALAEADALEAMVAASSRWETGTGGFTRQANAEATTSVYTTLSGCNICGRIGAAFYRAGHMQVCLAREFPAGGGARPPAATSVAGMPKGTALEGGGGGGGGAAPRANFGSGPNSYPPAGRGYPIPFTGAHAVMGPRGNEPEGGAPLPSGFGTSPANVEYLRASLAWEKETAELRRDVRNPRASLRRMLM